MPRISPEAPDLAVSPDGAWAAALHGPQLRLYDLRTPTKEGAPLEPIKEIERPDCVGRVYFLDNELLMHIFLEPVEEGENSLIAAELLDLPELSPVGPLSRVAGAQRIVGIGPGGAVVAPNGPGADILYLRHGELVLQRTFIRGEVLAAIAAPERRFLLEQRSGFDLWDPVTRGALSRLVLQTRTQVAQVGYVMNGRMLWALSSGPPVHIEVFRASDGRRFLEMDQPGKGLCAEPGPGRLVIAVEERNGPVFLDLDLSSGALSRVTLPEGSGDLLSFTVRPSAHNAEALVLTEASGARLVRLPLARLQTAVNQELSDGNSRGRGRAAPRDPTGGRTARLREQRPESRFVRRPTSNETSMPGAPSAIAANSAARPSSEVTDEDSAAEPPVSIVVGDAVDAGGDAALTAMMPMAAPLESNVQKRQRELLGHVYDPSVGPAAWQWELSRWAALSLSASEDVMRKAPPAGGPVQKMATRLKLSTGAQHILALLYACEHLIGARPKGMRLLEVVGCLSGLYEEPTLLGELLPSAPLRNQGIVTMRAGRLRLHPEAATALLEGNPPDIGGATAVERDPLAAGLYVHKGPIPRSTTILSSKPILRIDALGLPESKLAEVLERSLQRALFHDALVILDGVAGLAYPAFSGPSQLPALRSLLLAPRVPVIVCAMLDAVAAAGLSSRALPSSVVSAGTSGSAPLLPSAPLPGGMRWRGPNLPVEACFLDADATRGRLEAHQSADRRAAIVVGPSATPEGCAVAAYLAARDGAVLRCDVELSASWGLLLSMLLRQLPVVVTAVAGDRAGAPWPAALAPFAESPHKY